MTSYILPIAAHAAPIDEYQRFLNCGARKVAQKDLEAAIKQCTANGLTLSSETRRAFIRRIGEAQTACDGCDQCNAPVGP